MRTMRRLRRPFRRFGRGAALVIGAVVVTGAPVSAGTEPADDADDGQIDEAVLDQIREQLDAIGDDGDDDTADTTFAAVAALLGDVELTSDDSELSGPCGGYAVSYDGDGDLLDAAFDAGDAAPPIDLLDGTQAFTSSNPFEVDTAGRVAYYGFSPRTGEGPTDHDWSISAGGIPLGSGGDPNTSGDNRNAGEIDLGDDLPFGFALKAEVEGSMTSANLPECVGRGHVEFVGNGLATVPGAVAMVLALGGVAGLLFNARPARTWRS